MKNCVYAHYQPHLKPPKELLYVVDSYEQTVSFFFENYGRILKINCGIKVRFLIYLFKQNVFAGMFIVTLYSKADTSFQQKIS